MALGYEGYIMIEGSVVLGTGGAVPRNRARLDSSSGYAGEISGTSMGIGYPHAYDWSSWDGSVNVELTEDLFSVLKTWIVTDRDTTREILLSSRNTNNQTFNGYWNSISFAASVGDLVTSTIGFVSIERDAYVYGTDTQSKSLLDDSDIVPIPYWQTGIGSYKFLDWSLEFTQEVVKIFACRNSPTALEPAYIGVSPVSISLSGTYLFGEELPDSSSLTVTIGSGSFNLTKAELQTTSDAVQNHNSLTPIDVMLAAYGVT